MTPDQRRLEEVHGTPYAFSRALIIAIDQGMITEGEAEVAYVRYTDEWAGMVKPRLDFNVEVGT